MTSRLVLVAFLVASAMAVGRAQGPADQDPSFEVASIKPYGGDTSWTGLRPFPGRFVVQGVPASALVAFAYQSLASDVVGVPSWAKSERYDVNAKVSGTPDRGQYQAMMRTLLRERFNFAGHIETQPRDVLALVLVKPDAPLPPGLRRIDVDCEHPPDGLQSFRPSSLTEDLPDCFSIDTGSIINSGGMSMEQVAGKVRGYVGKQVVNETGLAGYFRFQLRYTRRDPRVPPPTDDAPDITTAIEEQLGLKVVPRKAAVKVMVVDRFERPTPD